jgi:hypothetical protein
MYALAGGEKDTGFVKPTSIVAVPVPADFSNVPALINWGSVRPPPAITNPALTSNVPGKVMDKSPFEEVQPVVRITPHAAGVFGHRTIAPISNVREKSWLE